MKISVIVLLALTISAQLKPQPTKKFEFSVNLSSIQSDNLGNIYFVKDGIILKKKDENGRILSTYSDSRNGTIASVDASNPMRIYVLFKDKQNVVVLDNQLVPLGQPYNLSNLGFNDISLVCRGIDNGFWVYDISTGIFSYISENGRILKNSVDIRRALNSRFAPQLMLLHNNELYAFEPDKGLIVLDINGNFINSFLKTTNRVSISNSGIFFAEDGYIKRFNRNSFLEEKLFKLSTDINFFYVNLPYLILGTDNKFSLYIF